MSDDMTLEERVARLEGFHKEWYCVTHELGGTACGSETCAIGRETQDSENCEPVERCQDPVCQKNGWT